jgi:hypothetical protein
VLVAQVTWPPGTRIEERRANAELIAAAPELLEAMMAIEERYIDGCDTYEDWKFMGDTARAALQFLHNDESIHGGKEPES